MAWGLRELYYLAGGFAQLLLAYLIVRAGRRRTIRVAFGVVVILSAVQGFGLYTKSTGVGNLPVLLRQSVDTAILLTLAYLLSQFPQPIGGERGATIARRAWLVVLGLAGVSSVATWALAGPDSAARALHRDVFHASAFPLITGLFALHFVPRWFETEPGPLRTQALFAGVALAASAIDWSVVQLIGRALDPARLLKPGLGAALHSLAAWLTLAALVRIGLNVSRSRDSESWLLLGLTGLAVLFGVHSRFSGTTGVVEVAAHVFRPVLFAIALLRFELLDIPSLERRWAVPVATVVFAGLAFLMALVVLAPEGLDAERVEPAAAFGGVLAVAGLAWSSRDVLAEELAAPSPGEDRGRALDRYRLAVEQARANGGGRDLPQLREDLGITETEHELVLASLEAGRRYGADSLRAAEPGDVIAGRYEVDRELGRGGQGRALAAWDHVDEEQVVLKEVLRPWEEGAERRRRALEREIELVGDLDEQGLAGVRGLVEASPRVYLVRDYVPGRTLDWVVEDEGPLEADEIARILGPLAAVLQRLHDRGLFHLDLKPGNVVLRDDGLPVLVDHGTVQPRHQAEAEATRTAADPSPDGTLAWMAPEQLLDEPLDERADVFALGALAYFLATGDTHLDLDRPAFRIEDELVRGRPPEDLDGPLAPLVRSCLARDPADRPATMDEVAGLLVQPSEETGEARA